MKSSNLLLALPTFPILAATAFPTTLLRNRPSSPASPASRLGFKDAKEGDVDLGLSYCGNPTGSGSAMAFRSPPSEWKPWDPVQRAIGDLPIFDNLLTNLFGVDRASLRRRGVPFLLAYSIVSNLNGAVSLSVAWYLTVRRTGASPLVPGGKRSLLASYAMIYGGLQLLKPFRVAAAVAMSKLSADWLDLTQDRLGCSRNAAIGCQYAMGLVAMGMTFSAGVTLVSLLTGVPIWG